MKNKEYTAGEWIYTKDEFLAAQEEVKAAFNVARDRIKTLCGQDIKRTVSVSTAFLGRRMIDWSYIGGYSEVSNTKIDEHWESSLSMVRRDIDILRSWAAPEKWEAEWARCEEELSKKDLEEK